MTARRHRKSLETGLIGYFVVTPTDWKDFARHWRERLYVYNEVRDSVLISRQVWAAVMHLLNLPPSDHTGRPDSRLIDGAFKYQKRC